MLLLIAIHSNADLINIFDFKLELMHSGILCNIIQVANVYTVFKLNCFWNTNSNEKTFWIQRQFYYTKLKIYIIALGRTLFEI